MSTISPHPTTFLCTCWNQCFLWSILVQDIAVMHGLIYRLINPVPLKKTEYHCNYTSELHRHLSEENLNAKYPPLTLPLKSTQNVTYFITTHQCRPVSTVRGTFYIISVQGTRYILTFM